jgi:translocator protein
MMRSYYSKTSSLALLALFIVVIVGVGSAIGILFTPGTWYASLVKPSFNPPNWLFGPVWTILYVLIAIAGWRTFLDRPSSRAMRLWTAQMLLNWLWTPVMFGANLIWPAFGVIVAMLAAIIGFITATRQTDPLSCWLFVPYLAWVSFASLLNLSLAILNG